jgi:hypothetical protein
MRDAAPRFRMPLLRQQLGNPKDIKQVVVIIPEVAVRWL